MTEIPDKISGFIELNKEIQNQLQSSLSEYDNTHYQRYEGSALISVARLEEDNQHENAGMIMFVFRHLEDSDNLLFTSHMEINYRTLNDKQDELMVPAEDIPEDEIFDFVRNKTKEFLNLYQDPPSLWEGKLE